MMHWRKRELNLSAAVLASLAALCCTVAFGEQDPNENATRVVPLEKPEQPLDTPAPLSQFVVPDGDDVWKRALNRASTLPADHTGGFFDASQLVGEGFRSAKKFKTEKYSEGENGKDLIFAICADEALKDGDKIILTQMRLVYFISKNPLLLAAGGKGAANHDAAKPGAPAAKKKENPKKKNAPAAPAMAIEGRVVITAPQAIIDINTNEGRASGSVKVEIFSKTESSKGDAPTAVLSSDRLRWRTWSEPWSGSTEMAMYACSEFAGDPEPLVSALYQMPSTDGPPTSVVIEGRGMIYETGAYDRPTPKEDEEGRTVGLCQTARNRAIFHREISLTTTAAAMSAFGLAFTGNEAATTAAAAPKVPHKEPPAAAPAAPTETIVSCSGPAILDMAVVPRKEESRIATSKGPKSNTFTLDVKTDTESEIVDHTILLARRFEFLNGVKMIRYPVPPEGSKKTEPPTDETTQMSCQHLRMQWAPGEMPRASAPPEYAEAIGGVMMTGTDVETPEPGSTEPPAKSAFNVRCQRLYFDGANDNMFLVGSIEKPVIVKHEKKGDATAQQFCYRRKVKTLTMPSLGPKRLVIRAAAMAKPPQPAVPDVNKPDAMFDFGAGDTIIDWNGALSRELVHLPVPQQPDRIKEILTLYENVVIDQPDGSLKMRGEKIRLVRNMPGGEVEFLETVGNVDVSMGQLKALGETVTVDMAYGPDGQLSKNLITVIGDRSKEIAATLFMSGSAVRSTKFLVDRKADNFKAFGGAVAVVKAAEQPEDAAPKPQAAQDAGALFTGISFNAGGNLFVQCDGEFVQDGATHKVVIKQNVIIRQPGLQLLADEVYLTLDDEEPAAAAAGAPKSPAAPAAPGTPPKAATPGDSFFSGKLKSIECRGLVELTTPDQLVQSDSMFYEVAKDSSLLEMDDPENDVRVYIREPSGNTKILSVLKNLKLDGKSGLFKPGGTMYMLPYRGSMPAPRGKENSPAKRRKIEK